MRKFLKDNRGFTLVEMLVAAAMLAVILVPLMRPFFVSLNATQRAVSYGAVTESVENAIEVVKSANINTMFEDLGRYYGEDKVEDLSTDTSLVYSVTNGAETIEVTIRAPDKGVDGELLAELNGSDLASFTNMDLSLIQAAGSKVKEDGSFELRDVDESAFNYFKSLIGSSSVPSDYTLDESSISRQILVTLTGRGEEVENERNVGVLHYNVKYNYWATYEKSGSDDIKEPKSYEQFAGTVSTGADGVVALQLVYIPMNSNAGGVNRETIEIEYKTHLGPQTAYVPDPDDDDSETGLWETVDDDDDDSETGLWETVGDDDDEDLIYEDYGLRLFVIKQQRMTHAITCNRYVPNQVVSEDAVFYCGDCAGTASGSDYEDNYYSCKLYLEEGLDDYEDMVMALHGNINVNMYTGETIDRAGAFSFEYAEEGEYEDYTDEFKDKLVVDASGDRISIVEVRTYQGSTETGYMKTVKLN